MPSTRSKVEIKVVVDGTLHRRLRTLAAEQDLPLNKVVVSILERAVSDPRYSSSFPR